jgi:DNA-binding GntR family transcriptional regulator
MRKKRTVRFEYGRAADFGLHRHTVYRALEQLAGAGLVKVDRGRGRSPVVTILEAPSG